MSLDLFFFFFLSLLSTDWLSLLVPSSTCSYYFTPLVLIMSRLCATVIPNSGGWAQLGSDCSFRSWNIRVAWSHPQALYLTQPSWGLAMGMVSSSPGQASWQRRLGAHTCSAVWLLCPGRRDGSVSIWTHRSPPGRTKPELDCHGWTEKGICVFWGLAMREALASILLSYVFPLHG